MILRTISPRTRLSVASLSRYLTAASISPFASSSPAKSQSIWTDIMVRHLRAGNALADRLQISGFLLRSDYRISFDFIGSPTIRLSIMGAAHWRIWARPRQTVNRRVQGYGPARKGLTLNFENGTVHSIRSVSQRALAAAWARLCNEGLPSF